MHDKRVDFRILGALREASGAFVSGENLSRDLGISRAAFWKRIHRLRDLGYCIEARSRRGYRLAASPEAPVEEAVLPLLQTRFLGRELRYLASTDSTNSQLEKLARAGAPEGTVMTADEQTAGRGRMAREWFSPPGANLYFSLLLRPRVPPAAAVTLSLLAGLAIARAVEEVTPGLAPRIKWPNDLWIDDRKLCGILCDMQAEADCVRYLIVGVGVNVNLLSDDWPPELARRAISLRDACGHPVSRAKLLAAILNRFEKLYRTWTEQGLAPFLDTIRKRDALAGRRITLEQGGRRIAGKALGLSPDGSLLLERDGEPPLAVWAGDVHITGMDP